MTPERFQNLLLEFIDEDPFALRAVLKLLRVEFTEEVPTLAVTCEERPRLQVNLAFVQSHCRTDAEVKAVICHELLHVLLRHTETRAACTPSWHLAFDAVINAIIHRELGPSYSSMMSRYYAAAEGPMKLLRPPTPVEPLEGTGADDPAWARAWPALYQGRLVVDDVSEIAQDLAFGDGTNANLIGNHQDEDGDLSEEVRDALDEALKRMNGSGIWRSPRAWGAGGTVYQALFTAADERVRRWERKTLEILRRHLLPDPKARTTEERPHDYVIPVLSPGDRRAFMRSLWLPFLPDASWKSTAPHRAGTAQVYLDVSGSMNAEMPLVGLLARLSKYIRRPFWAFSNVVAPAVIERGQLRADTTGGTSLSCVLEHLATTRPEAAVIVTDGYIEEVPRELVTAIGGVRLHALVTRDGDPSELKRAGISYSQLEKVSP